MLTLTLLLVPSTAGADGQSWSTVASPNTGASTNALNSVSCVSVSDCTAVGYYDDGARLATLILHWDGSAWATVSSPNSGASTNVLNSVACVSASDCTAVGFYDDGTRDATLALRSVDPNPPAPTTSTTSNAGPVAPAFTG